ncbi:MAG TPA: glycosyltransferase family 39 protein [Verrucomicrobiae bacterium]|nr:glycosyltransferase family 39 protein [Verrucomicrobiae bacterium]
MRAQTPAGPGIGRIGWPLAFAATAGLLVWVHLSGLAQAPPGLYADEASAGYNGWAVMHFGVDQHGVHWPLYFKAFGEYRNPVYVYSVGLASLLLPLSPTVARLPAAFYSLVICLGVTLAVWFLTRDRAATLVTLITVGLMPWVMSLGRVAFSVVSMVAFLSLALFCLVRALEGRRGWWLAAGAALAVSVLAYSTGRLFGGLLGVAIVVGVASTGLRRWWRGLLLMVVPLVAVYGGLVIWSEHHPGALLVRYRSISIGWDSPQLGTLVARFVGNYVQYFGVPFLFTHGDTDLRQNIGFGGMLAVATLPALAAGLIVCLRRWREPLFRALLLGLLAAPVPAALTATASPDALRSAEMLPFLAILIGVGWAEILPILRSHRSWAGALAAVAAIEVGAYLFTLFAVWPGESYYWFDVGEGAAIARAHTLAHGHEVLLSTSLDVPYIQALFWLRPNPARYAREGLRILHMDVAGPAGLARAAPGDLMVLSPQDPVPAGSRLLFTESYPVHVVSYQAGQPPEQVVPLVVVYRRIRG